MALRIYNTLIRQKDLFEPLIPGQVRMYVCGITAYDFCHIGHARSAVVFDVIRRYLVYKGYRVKFVKNFTDVDDKIIKRANEEGISAGEVSERYIAEYREDMESLGILPADVEPKATEHIPQMIALIERLLARGFAYVVDGNVYFEVRRFPRYGRLSGKDLDELLVGARVEVDERKRDPRDFALWKSAKPGEPSWESPWGPGRPGWHIECSAMSMEHLGESFDIHGGGEDLIFPHHECEIAQSEAATDRPFVRCWVHNGFVNLGAEKMSKSLGNILTVKELVKSHHPEALRLYLLGTHYRSPLEFTEDRVREYTRALDRLSTLIVEADQMAAGRIQDRRGELTESAVRRVLGAIEDDALRREITEHATSFHNAMDDDFNTPEALGALFQLSHVLYRCGDSIDQAGRKVALRRGVEVLFILGRVLGLFGQRRSPIGLSFERRAEIEQLIAQREDARKRRDWKLADEIRDRLLREYGVSVEDTPAGTRWKWRGA